MFLKALCVSFFFSGLVVAQAEVGLSPQAGLWSQYPVTYAFKLSNGLKVPLPYRSVADYVAVTGMVNTEKLNAILADEELTSVRFNAAMEPDSNGVSLVTAYVLDYKDSSVGPYREILVSTFAKSTSSQHPDRFGYFCLSIKVNQDSALKLGIEYFGLLKSLSVINIELQNDETFQVHSADGEIDISGTCADCKNLSSNLLPQTFFFISPFQVRRTWYEFSNLGRVAIRPFDPAKDRFELGNGSTGELLRKLEFYPLNWMNGKNVYIAVSSGS